MNCSIIIEGVYFSGAFQIIFKSHETFELNWVTARRANGKIALEKILAEWMKIDEKYIWWMHFV